MKKLIDNVSWYLIIAIVGIANFVKRHHLIISVILVSIGCAIAMLFLTGCFPTPNAMNDLDHNGLNDAEETTWDIGEWGIAALSYFVPGAAAAGAVVQAVRKTREASVRKKASELQYKQTDRLLERLPCEEQAAEKKTMEKEQKAAGVNEIVEAAKPKA